MSREGWEFWIDRGGTFTDVIGLAPNGRRRTAKLLSSDRSPVDGVRRLLEEAGELPPGAALPACTVKLGTTVATNALLERRGVRTLLVTNRGLGDVFTIGTQERPALFALRIERPPPLHESVLEIGGRVGRDGRPVEPFDEAALRAALARARAAGLGAVAVVAMHAYASPELEARVAHAARAAGFEHVVASHELAREMGFLARGETAIADAYLTPLLRRHAETLAEALPGARIRFMQSSGGLTDAARFRGPAALLSGPAGGVVGAARVARAAGFSQAVGFDMGGTSTDVSLIANGEAESVFETELAGIRVRAPMLRIHSVAAGGGSLCRFDGFRLTVGPKSAGADPGPLCYGLRDAAGHPRARELTLTDVNFALGRLPPDRFPLPLEHAPVEAALDALRARIAAAGHRLSRDEIAAGFVEIANASMAQAVTQVSVARGVDPRNGALVGFGGAGGQHVCQLARRLGIRTVLLHPLAGLLSAFGIGVADLSWDGQRDAGRCVLPAAGGLPAVVEEALRALEDAGRSTLIAEGASPAAVRVERRLDLRYAGAEAALPVEEPAESGRRNAQPVSGAQPLEAERRSTEWRAAFEAAHHARFGYTRSGRGVEIVTARVRVRAPGTAGMAAEVAGMPPPGPPRPRRLAPAWFPEVGRTAVPLYDREALGPGHTLAGPAILLEATGTVVLDPGFEAEVAPDGCLRVTDVRAGAPVEPAGTRADPVRLEVFGNRFMSIAEQMGAVLRNTAVSTNIKERLDYSCAVFDPDGGLVANAPHIPVHLGAMGATVRAVRHAIPELGPGDVVATNDPFHGGSHLPDVTVVTPVFLGGGPAPDFFVASRGHHADIGGRTPGSMPADSRSLDEEGVRLRPFRIVSGGRFEEARVRRALRDAPYPARHPEDNLADLEAMIAANRAGARLLGAFVEEAGLAWVTRTMGELQEAAAAKVAREIDRLPDGEHAFEDRLDDGTPLCVRMRVRGTRMLVDFAGTGAAVSGNLNAPRAVVEAAVLYVLRSLVAEPIPLNGGCLAPVEIRVPSGSLLDPPEGAAVVGGNVETSQRVVDVLLGALGRLAASQGTMNNVAFGDAHFGYYETIGGGAGAGPDFPGASGVHVHMTNTRITDAEVLEARYPVRLVTFALRHGSGGAGRFRGGDGIVRRYEFLAPVTASLLTERRVIPPFGLAGGAPGACGRNAVERADGRVEELPGKATVALAPGDRLVVETPGGGGYGKRSAQRAGGERSPQDAPQRSASGLAAPGRPP